MLSALSWLLALSTTAVSAPQAQYLPEIQQRWDVSDLVCIGTASPPVPTQQTRTIDGSERDELSTEVDLESCFKGATPAVTRVHVIGYSMFATEDSQQGYAYSGPPVGFIEAGRNLLFLRGVQNTGTYEVVVPVYQTAIHLADTRPDTPGPASTATFKQNVTKELEAALVQYDETDISAIGSILDLLGQKNGASELAAFSHACPLTVRRDIAVALLPQYVGDNEPTVISLLLDPSAIPWKRQNAASALGDDGTVAALAPLEQLSSQSVSAEDLKSLQLTAHDALERPKHRLNTP